jgi:hypothetical protein
VKNFRKIPRSTVWRRLIREEDVYAVILKSRNWKSGVYNLRTNWSIHEINSLLSEKEENIDFYIPLKDEKGAG